MRKIGIITLNGYYNYGNRLQNYALQEFLKSQNFQVETIVKTKKINQKSDRVNRTVKRVNNLAGTTIKEIYEKANNKIVKYMSREVTSERKEIFKDFTVNYIKETDWSISDDNIPENLSDKYDYFITGSDQVWNPSSGKVSPIYFLTFAERHKRIAYSPSFGVSEMLLECRDDYKKWLSEIHKISVREEDGASLIKELTGRDVPVLVDPTLLLTKEKWLSISNEANNKPKGKYLLTYFLGGVPDNYKKQIKKIAKEKKLEVINLGEIREKETYQTGPSEFLDYVSSCSIFCTDSFHGAVFSILFEKPFIVYKRAGSPMSIYSRIDTLLNKFNLNSRKFENININEDVFSIDYSHIPEILESERQKSFEYLKEALNI